MPGFVRIIWKVGFDAFWHFTEDDGWAMASHVALSILLAIFPFLIFGTTLATFGPLVSIVWNVLVTTCNGWRPKTSVTLVLTLTVSSDESGHAPVSVTVFLSVESAADAPTAVVPLRIEMPNGDAS